MPFNASSYFAGVGTVFAAVALGFAVGFAISNSATKPEPPNRLERVAANAPLSAPANATAAKPEDSASAAPAAAAPAAPPPAASTPAAPAATPAAAPDTAAPRTIVAEQPA